MTIFLLLIFQFHVSAFLLSSLLPSLLVEWLYFWGIAKLKRVNAELNKFVMVVVFAYFLNWINPWQSETQKFPFRLLHCCHQLSMLSDLRHSFLIINGIFLSLYNSIIALDNFLQLLAEKIWSVSKIPTIIVIKMQCVFVWQINYTIERWKSVPK